MNTIKTEMRELCEGVKARVTWQVDDHYNDLSWLGEFVRKEPCEGWYVAAQKGLLYDSRGDVVETFLPTRNSYYIRDATYWVPGENHLPPGEESRWERVQGAERVKVIAEHGSIRNADISYIVADYKRHLSLYHNEWEMTGCSVEIFVGGVEWRGDSLWGIESDCGEEHMKWVENECIQEALIATQEAIRDYGSKIAYLVTAVDVLVEKGSNNVSTEPKVGD